jgi:hypothetical protein
MNMCGDRLRSMERCHYAMDGDVRRNRKDCRRVIVPRRVSPFAAHVTAPASPPLAGALSFGLSPLSKS